MINGIHSLANSLFPAMKGSDFWLSGTGICCLISLLLCSLYNMFSTKMDEDIFDRIYFGVCALTCISVLMHLHNGTIPQNANATIVIALAMRMPLAIIQRLWFHRKTGKAIPTSRQGH